MRNRLTRLVASGMVERRAEQGGGGRPKHTYQASVEAHKRLGQNYADLAVVLWDEMMRSVEDGSGLWPVCRVAVQTVMSGFSF